MAARCSRPRGARQGRAGGRLTVRDTSYVVNRLVELCGAHAEAIRALNKGKKPRRLSKVDAATVMAMLERVGAIENHRLGHMVALIAGRRGIDKLPPHQQEQLAAVAAAMAGVEKRGREKRTKAEPDDE